MARVSVSLVGVVAMAVALAVPAHGAISAPVPPRDVVLGGGESGTFPHISINASSDALGGDPSGDVSFVIEVEVFGRPTRALFAGPVTCLAVEGNRAVIGALAHVGPFVAPVTAVVVDNGSTGSPADEIAIVGDSTDCSDLTILPTAPLSGDIVVRDAPSPAQCHDGGWRNYTDEAGQPFKSQGACIAFALGAA